MRPLNVPVKEILFAAKTGFLTRRLWEEFFAEGSFSWRCRQWIYFSERKFFRPHPSPLARDTLVLDRRNQMVLKLVGEDFSSPPYVSQLTHDEVIARALMQLSCSATVHSFKTEMELKKESLGGQRVYSPNDRTKYPDAVIEIGGPNARIKVALELELTRKDPKRYRQCLNTYTANGKVQKVVFVARSGAVFESLKRAMRDTYYPDWERPIGFVWLDDWTKNPSEAVICFSERNTTLAELNKESAA